MSVECIGGIMFAIVCVLVIITGIVTYGVVVHKDNKMRYKVRELELKYNLELELLKNERIKDKKK